MAKEPSIDLSLEGLNGLPDANVGVVLILLELSLQLLDLVEKPLDITSTGDAELFLLVIGEITDAFEVFDTQEQRRVELVASTSRPAETAEDPLVELSEVGGLLGQERSHCIGLPRVRVVCRLLIVILSRATPLHAAVPNTAAISSRQPRCRRFGVMDVSHE